MTPPQHPPIIINRPSDLPGIKPPENALKQWKAKDIVKYHDALLSVMAWPENKEQLQQAKTEMVRLTSIIKEIISVDKMMDYKLSGSGIAGTELTGCFSYAITRWLVNDFSNDLELHSSEANHETVRLFFLQLIPSIEYESVTTGELGLIQRIRKIKGKNNSTDIKWLISLFETVAISYHAKEFLFNELKIFVTWKLNLPFASRSYSCLPQKNIFYDPKLLKATDVKKIGQRKLPLPNRLSIKQKKQLVDVAKSTLLFIYRETDPFTFASADAVKLFTLEKGYSIGLYSMQKGHRLSIESYIGYLVFKNGIPVSYGGGWIFGKRCQFGINILEPFRGSESGYIFSLLIRVYHQYFDVNRFVVKPYQFGKNNKEALKSGAFWFYYKHGFRPEDVQLQKLADDEWDKKAIDKRYRTSIDLLKKFTSSNLVLLLSKKSVPVFDASVVSLAITSYINQQFNGNRNKAVAASEKKTITELNIKNLTSWNTYEREALIQWSLLVQAMLDLSKWKMEEKKQLLKLIKSKGDDEELNFIKMLQGHRRLWKELCNKLS